MNEQEYERGWNALVRECKAYIQHGGNRTKEYREPRRLRLLAALYKKNLSKLDEGQGQVIMAIPNFELLDAIVSSLFYPTALKEKFKVYANAFIQDQTNREQKPYLSIAAMGSGAITLETAKHVFGSSLDDFLSFGLVSKRELLNVGEVLFPLLPELSAYYSIDLIKDIVIKNDDLDIAYTSFLSLCTALPYGDIIGAQVLLRIAKEERIQIFIHLVNRLWADSPRKEGITKGAKLLSYHEDLGHLQFNFMDDLDDGGLISNFFPYIILSQLIAYPFGIGDENTKDEFKPYLNLVNKVGSTPLPMVRMYALPFSEMQSLETYNFKKTGEVITGTSGVVEPFVQSIIKVFHQAPDLIEWLYKDAIRKRNFQLLWRIYMGVRNEVSNTDEDIANRAIKFKKEFDTAFPSMFEEIIKE